MGINFLHHLNMNQNQINGLVLESLAAAPESAIAGRLYYDTADEELKYYSGTAWISMVSKNRVSALEEAVGNWANTENDAIAVTIGKQFDSDDTTGLWGSMRDVRSRLSTAEETLKILTDASDTNSIIDKWIEVKNFLASFGDTDSLEDVLQNYVKGTYDPTSTVYTLSNSIDFEGAALAGYESAGNYDMAWLINKSGQASFKSVQIKSGDVWKPALHTGNTSFIPKLTTGTEIGSITIGGATAIKLYAPTKTTVSNTLNNTSADVALSAAQGKALNDKITSIETALGDLDYLAEVTAMDTTPTQNSTNLVTSGGVYAAIAEVNGTGGSTIKKHVFTITGDGTKTQFVTNVGTALGYPDSGKIVIVYDANGYQVFPETAVQGNFITLNFATAPANGTTYKVVAIM